MFRGSIGGLSLHIFTEALVRERLWSSQKVAELEEENVRYSFLERKCLDIF